MLDFADRTGSSIFMEVWPQMGLRLFGGLSSDLLAEIKRASREARGWER